MRLAGKDTVSAPSTEPVPLEIVTAENDAEFAALLAGDLSDCGDAIDDFAARHRGRNVEFDGNVADRAPHGDYDTRFDFLIWGGDYSLEPIVYFGPPMQFEDVNRSDLNLVGDNVPSDGDPRADVVPMTPAFRDRRRSARTNPYCRR